MNELKILIKAVTADAQKNMAAVKKELQGISQEAKSTSDKFGAAMKGMAKATAIVVAAITAVIAAITGLGKSTLEFQRQVAQLNAAFASMGKSGDVAARTYKDFYRFLGDTGKAVEASNLLIKLTQNEANLAEWTKILQGVYASFPDSLPIEALVESANETARVGQITGNLADALNWAGESEDAFNEKLAQTTSVEEREALIRNTLNRLYGSAAAIYEKNNKALLEYNEAQAEFQQKAAAAGATVTPLLTVLTKLGSAIMSVLKPALETVIPYIAGFVMWLTEAVNRVASFFGILSGSSKSVTAVGEATSTAMRKVSDGTGKVTAGLNAIKSGAEAARKAALGFDELNIVSKPSGGGGGGTGALEGVGDLNISGLTDGFDTALVNLEDFKKRAEEVKERIQQFMDDWGWALKTIGGILAGLSIRSLIIQFASLAGAGETVAKALSFGGIIAGIKKLSGWLGAVIGLMKEGFGFWEVMGAAFPKLAAAITKVGGAISGTVKAVGAFIGGLSGATIAAVIAVVIALASAVYFLWKNWDDVVAKVKEFANSNLAPIVESIKESFSQLWEAIKGLGQSFADLGVAIWNALPDSVKEWLADAVEWIKNLVKAIGEWFASVEWLKIIGTIFEAIGGVVVGSVGGLIAGAIQSLLTMIDGAVKIITGVVQIVTGLVSGLINLIVGLFTGDFKKALNSAKQIWEGIKNVFKGAVTAVGGVVKNFVQGIIDFFKNMWDVLVGHSIVPDTIEAIIEWFASLPVKVFELVSKFVQGVINFFTDLANKVGEWAINIWEKIKAPFAGVGSWFTARWADVKNALGDVGSWFSDTFTKAYSNTTTAFANAKTGFANVWSNIKAGFGNVSDWFRTTFTSAWEAVKNVFSTGGKIFDGIKDGILSGLKAVVNGIIDGINRVIAIPFNGINSALNTIRNFNIVGMSPFKWLPTITVPQIPRLAKGGIVDQATIAMIGERGKEAVVPLENNTEWIDKLVDRLAERQDRPEKIVLELDGRELGWANINSINNITRQTGSLQLTLA